MESNNKTHGVIQGNLNVVRQSAQGQGERPLRGYRKDGMDPPYTRKEDVARPWAGGNYHHQPLYYTPAPSANISPRQSFQENMNRYPMPPASEMKSYHELSDVNKLNVTGSSKYCEGPILVKSQHANTPGHSYYSSLSAPVEHQRLTGPVDHQRLASSIDHQRLASSVDHQRLVPSVDHQRLAPSVDHQRLSTSVDHQRLAPPVNHQRLAPSVDYQHSATSADHQRLAAPVDHQRLASSVDHQRLAPSVDYQHLATSADHQRLAPPVDHQRLASSVDHQRLAPVDHQRLAPSVDHQRLAPPVDHQRLSTSLDQRFSSSLDHQRLSNSMDHQRYIDYPPVQVIKNTLHRTPEDSPYRLPSTSNYPCKAFSRVGSMLYEPYPHSKERYVQPPRSDYPSMYQYPPERVSSMSVIDKFNEVKKRLVHQPQEYTIHHFTPPSVHTSDHRSKAPVPVSLRKTQPSLSSTGYYPESHVGYQADIYPGTQGKSYNYAGSTLEKNLQYNLSAKPSLQDIQCRQMYYPHYSNMSYHDPRVGNDSTHNIAFNKNPSSAYYAPMNIPYSAVNMPPSYQKPYDIPYSDRSMDYDPVYYKHTKNVPSTPLDNPLDSVPTQFSPNIISPASSASCNSVTTLPPQSLEDGGYVSQCSTSSGRSSDPNTAVREMVDRNIDMNKSEHNKNSLKTTKNKTNKPAKESKKSSLDLRQYYSTWVEELDDIPRSQEIVENINVSEPCASAPVPQMELYSSSSLTTHPTYAAENSMANSPHGSHVSVAKLQHYERNSARKSNTSTPSYIEKQYIPVSAHNLFTPDVGTHRIVHPTERDPLLASLQNIPPMARSNVTIPSHSTGKYEESVSAAHVISNHKNIPSSHNLHPTVRDNASVQVFNQYNPYTARSDSGNYSPYFNGRYSSKPSASFLNYVNEKPGISNIPATKESVSQRESNDKTSNLNELIDLEAKISHSVIHKDVSSSSGVKPIEMKIEIAPGYMPSCLDTSKKDVGNKRMLLKKDINESNNAGYYVDNSLLKTNVPDCNKSKSETGMHSVLSHGASTKKSSVGNSELLNEKNIIKSKPIVESSECGNALLNSPYLSYPNCSYSESSTSGLLKNFGPNCVSKSDYNVNTETISCNKVLSQEVKKGREEISDVKEFVHSMGCIEKKVAENSMPPHETVLKYASTNNESNLVDLSNNRPRLSIPPKLLDLNKADSDIGFSVADMIHNPSQSLTRKQVECINSPLNNSDSSSAKVSSESMNNDLNKPENRIDNGSAKSDFAMNPFIDPPIKNEKVNEFNQLCLTNETNNTTYGEKFPINYPTGSKLDKITNFTTNDNFCNMTSVDVTKSEFKYGSSTHIKELESQIVATDLSVAKIYYNAESIDNNNFNITKVGVPLKTPEIVGENFLGMDNLSYSKTPYDCQKFQCLEENISDVCDTINKFVSDSPKSIDSDFKTRVLEKIVSTDVGTTELADNFNSTSDEQKHVNEKPSKDVNVGMESELQASLISTNLEKDSVFKNTEECSNQIIVQDEGEFDSGTLAPQNKCNFSKLEVNENTVSPDDDSEIINISECEVVNNKDLHFELKVDEHNFNDTNYPDQSDKDYLPDMSEVTANDSNISQEYSVPQDCERTDDSVAYPAENDDIERESMMQNRKDDNSNINEETFISIPKIGEKAEIDLSVQTLDEPYSDGESSSETCSLHSVEKEDMKSIHNNAANKTIETNSNESSLIEINTDLPAATEHSQVESSGDELETSVIDNRLSNDQNEEVVCQPEIKDLETDMETSSVQDKVEKEGLHIDIKDDEINNIESADSEVLVDAEEHNTNVEDKSEHVTPLLEGNNNEYYLSINDVKESNATNFDIESEAIRHHIESQFNSFQLTDDSNIPSEESVILYGVKYLNSDNCVVILPETLGEESVTLHCNAQKVHFKDGDDEYAQEDSCVPWIDDVACVETVVTEGVIREEGDESREAYTPEPLWGPNSSSRDETIDDDDDMSLTPHSQVHSSESQEYEDSREPDYATLINNDPILKESQKNLGENEFENLSLAMSNEDHSSSNFSEVLLKSTNAVYPPKYKYDQELINVLMGEVDCEKKEDCPKNLLNGQNKSSPFKDTLSMQNNTRRIEMDGKQDLDNVYVANPILYVPSKTMKFAADYSDSEASVLSYNSEGSSDIDNQALRTNETCGTNNQPQSTPRTKGAQKYIPPLSSPKNSLICRLPLPPKKLLSFRKKKSNKQCENFTSECSKETIPCHIKIHQETPKKTKLSFDESLLSINESNITWCKKKLAKCNKVQNKKMTESFPKKGAKKDEMKGLDNCEPVNVGMYNNQDCEKLDNDISVNITNENDESLHITRSTKDKKYCNKRKNTNQELKSTSVPELATFKRRILFNDSELRSIEYRRDLENRKLEINLPLVHCIEMQTQNKIISEDLVNPASKIENYGGLDIGNDSHNKKIQEINISNHRKAISSDSEIEDCSDKLELRIKNSSSQCSTQFNSNCNDEELQENPVSKIKNRRITISCFAPEVNNDCKEKELFEKPLSKIKSRRKTTCSAHEVDNDFSDEELPEKPVSKIKNRRKTICSAPEVADDFNDEELSEKPVSKIKNRRKTICSALEVDIDFNDEELPEKPVSKIKNRRKTICSALEVDIDFNDEELPEKPVSKIKNRRKTICSAPEVADDFNDEELSEKPVSKIKNRRKTICSALEVDIDFNDEELPEKPVSKIKSRRKTICSAPELANDFSDEKLPQKPVSKIKSHRKTICSAPEVANDFNDEELPEKPVSKIKSRRKTICSVPELANDFSDEKLPEKPVSKIKSHRKTICSAPEVANDFNDEELPEKPVSKIKSRRKTICSALEVANDVNDEELPEKPVSKIKSRRKTICSAPEVDIDFNDEELPEKPVSKIKSRRKTICSAPEVANDVNDEELPEKPVSKIKSRRKTICSAPEIENDWLGEKKVNKYNKRRLSTVDDNSVEFNISGRCLRSTTRKNVQSVKNISKSLNGKKNVKETNKPVGEIEACLQKTNNALNQSSNKKPARRFSVPNVSQQSHADLSNSKSNSKKLIIRYLSPDRDEGGVTKGGSKQSNRRMTVCYDVDVSENKSDVARSSDSFKRSPSAYSHRRKSLCYELEHKEVMSSSQSKYKIQKKDTANMKQLTTTSDKHCYIPSKNVTDGSDIPSAFESSANETLTHSCDPEPYVPQTLARKDLWKTEKYNSLSSQLVDKSNEQIETALLKRKRPTTICYDSNPYPHYSGSIIPNYEVPRLERYDGLYHHNSPIQHSPYRPNKSWNWNTPQDSPYFSYDNVVTKRSRLSYDNKANVEGVRENYVGPTVSADNCSPSEGDVNDDWNRRTDFYGNSFQPFVALHKNIIVEDMIRHKKSGVSFHDNASQTSNISTSNGPISVQEGVSGSLAKRDPRIQKFYETQNNTCVPLQDKVNVRRDPRISQNTPTQSGAFHSASFKESVGVSSLSRDPRLNKKPQDEPTGNISLEGKVGIPSVSGDSKTYQRTSSKTEANSSTTNSKDCMASGSQKHYGGGYPL